MPAPPALVLLNPHAGAGSAAALHRPLLAALRELGSDTPLAAPLHADEARHLLHAQTPGTRIVVLGGDGTVHQLLAPLVQHGLELALIAHGSGNDLARALGLALRPRNLLAALHGALHGPARAIDLGEVRTRQGTRLFASSLAAGFDAAVGERALHAPRWLRGRGRYLWATFGELAHLRNYTVQVSVDGARGHEGPLLFASSLNTPSYGAGLRLAPMARLDDARLQLVVAGAFGPWGTLAMLPRLMRGAHLGHAKVNCLAFSQAHLRSRRPLPLAADGEALTEDTEIHLRVRQAALRVVSAPALPSA